MASPFGPQKTSLNYSTQDNPFTDSFVLARGPQTFSHYYIELYFLLKK